MAQHQPANLKTTLVERAAEKQAARDQDRQDLASGKKTVAQLRRENSFVVPAPDATIDYRSIPRARLR
jgi:hypothetical protein